MKLASFKHCKGCIHLGKVASLPCCNYIFDTGKCRPCPPGEGCTVKETRKRNSGGDHNRPDFKAINEQHEKEKAIRDQMKAVADGLTAQRMDCVNRAYKAQRRMKGK